MVDSVSSMIRALPRSARGAVARAVHRVSTRLAKPNRSVGARAHLTPFQCRVAAVGQSRSRTFNNERQDKISTDMLSVRP